MIETGLHIEMSGTITATGTGTFTTSLDELFVDGQWRKFSPAKSLNIAETDYDASLTPQELELVRSLADKNKDATMLSPDEHVLARSIIAKLTKVNQ